MKIALNLSKNATNELSKRSKLLGITQSATIHLLWYMNVRDSLKFTDLVVKQAIKENQIQIQVKDYLVELFNENQSVLNRVNNKYSLYIEHILTDSVWNMPEDINLEKKQMIVNVSKDVYEKLIFIKNKTNVSIKSILSYSLKNYEISLDEIVQNYNSNETIKVNISIPHYLKNKINKVIEFSEITNNMLVNCYLQKFLEKFNQYLEKFEKE